MISIGERFRSHDRNSFRNNERSILYFVNFRRSREETNNKRVRLWQDGIARETKSELCNSFAGYGDVTLRKKSVQRMFYRVIASWLIIVRE